MLTPSTYIGLLKDIVRLMTWETPKSGINPVTQLTRERANLWLQSVDMCVCKITLQSQGGRVCQSFCLSRTLADKSKAHIPCHLSSE